MTDQQEEKLLTSRDWFLEGTRPGGGSIRPVAVLEKPTAVTEGIRIVDADTHFCEPHDTWTSRAPAAYRDRVPHVQMIDGQDQWVMERNMVLGATGTSVIRKDGGKLLGKLTLPSYSEMIAGSYDAKARNAIMDDLGIWAQIAYPNSHAVSGSALIRLPDVELRNAIVSTYNDAAAEWQAATNNRMFPQAVLPIWDRNALAKESLRAAEMGLTGFTLPDRPEQWGLPDFMSDHWAPLFELCNARRLPLDFHLSSGIDGFQFAWQGYPFETKMAVGSMLFYITNSATVANFLFSGLFDRYPNLKLVSVESGAGWVPFVLEALEYQFDEMMPNESKKLKRRPKEYFKDHFYACYWFEETGPRQFIEALGPDNLLFETDFPHPTSLYPAIHSRIERVFAALPVETRRKVLQENAQKLYNLPIPA